MYTIKVFRNYVLVTSRVHKVANECFLLDVAWYARRGYRVEVTFDDNVN